MDDDLRRLHRDGLLVERARSGDAQRHRAKRTSDARRIRTRS
jgi:hypothetical protein